MRRAGVAFAALYLVVLAALAALKLTTWLFGATSWPDITYGPAITIIGSSLLLYAAVRVECWVRDRA